LIALKFLQAFREAVLLGVGMESLLDDEDVWSVELEYRLIKAITFDPTIGSRSNFTRVFRGSFAWGSYGMATRLRGISGRPYLSIGSKVP
jgi:hypothetical protein